MYKVELAKNDESKEFDKGDNIMKYHFSEKNTAIKFMKKYMKDYPDGYESETIKDEI